jgi:hypothetical protein
MFEEFTAKTNILLKIATTGFTAQGTSLGSLRQALGSLMVDLISFDRLNTKTLVF